MPYCAVHSGPSTKSRRSSALVPVQVSPGACQVPSNFLDREQIFDGVFQQHAFEGPVSRSSPFQDACNAYLIKVIILLPAILTVARLALRFLLLLFAFEPVEITRSASSAADILR